MQTEIGVCYGGRFASAIETTSTPLHYLGKARVRNPRTILRVRRELIRVIRERRIELLVTHTSWSHAIFATVAKSMGIPVVFWVHDLFTGWHWLQEWAKRTPPDGLILNSEFTNRESHLPRWNIPREMIYNPVRTQEMSHHRDRTIRRALLTSLGTGKETYVISQIGRIDAYKGHRLLLSALSLLPRDLNWVCWIIGAPSSAANKRLWNELQRSAYSFGIAKRVHFLGERTDIGDLLDASDVVVHPNLKPEPFGNTIIEALLRRLPVIATDMGGAAEILAPKYGILVPADNPKALAAAIASLIKDPTLAASFGDHGPERALELCDPVIQVRKYCSFFERIVGGAPAHRGRLQ